jgi:ElaB/YqjD/DUF883 family membrane-anchored ribosome-binding protein
MTVSPGVTRLDRVLDLVTDHEAQFRDHELRVVDLSTRVAAVERAVGVTEARSASTVADGTPYGEYPEDDVPLDLRSELADVRASVAHLREEVAEALHEVRSETKSLVDDAKATKAGFKSVLRDVLDRVASQLDAVRAAQRHDGTGGSIPGGDEGTRFASAAALAALTERVALAETVAEQAGAAALSVASFSATVSPSPSRRTSSGNTRERDGTARLSETEHRVDALFEEMRRLKDENDDLKRRVAKSASESVEGGGFGGVGFGGGVGFVSSDAVGGVGGPWNKYMPADDAVAEQLRQLARRFDEQSEQTEALKKLVLETRAERSGSGSGSVEVDAKRVPSSPSPSASRLKNVTKGHILSYNSPRVRDRSGGGDETDDDDGLIRLGFGAYAGASVMAKSYGQTSSQKRRSGALKNTIKIPLNAGFVAEAAARTRYGSASRREDADRATESFRAYLAGLPETRSGGSVSKKNASNHAATRRLSH